MNFLLFTLICLLIETPVVQANNENNVFVHSFEQVYDFIYEPVDVVIPSTHKDLDTLNLCIQGIRENCAQIRRIIVVSKEPLTDQAEWFCEDNFPFKKIEVMNALCEGNVCEWRSGWYYQQLLKLYSSFVIPNISSNVLILDSDTVFLNPVTFINEKGEPLYNIGSEHYSPYFSHLNKLLPGLKKVFSEYSGITHHMLFQKTVLEDLFFQVEKYHKNVFWKAFCYCVDHDHVLDSGASEYELYFNFLFSRSSKPHIRQLKWKDSKVLNEFSECQKEGYHYISCHAWFRD